MDLAQYVKSEIESVRPIDESTQVFGETDVYKGDAHCGPHHHEYVLWSPQIGYGKTGDALDNPATGKLVAATHEHMIIDGKVLEVMGHTHKLLPGKNALSTDPPKSALCVKEED